MKTFFPVSRIFDNEDNIFIFFGVSHFLLIDATDISKILGKISSDQKRLFFAVNIYPLSYFVNTPFKEIEFFGVP